MQTKHGRWKTSFSVAVASPSQFYRWYSVIIRIQIDTGQCPESPDYVGGARIEDELEFTEGTSHHPMQGSHVNTWFDHSENADAMDPLDPLSDEGTS